MTKFEIRNKSRLAPGREAGDLLRALVPDFPAWATRGGIGDSHAPAIDAEAVGGEQADRLGVGDFFFFENTMGERFSRVSFFDGAGALEDDGAAVVEAVYEVNGAAADFAAAVEDGLVDLLAVHAFAAEAGEEGGVDVHDAAGVSLGQIEQTEPASEADEIDLGGVDGGENFAAEGGDIRKFATVDHGDGQAGGLGTLDS